MVKEGSIVSDAADCETDSQISIQIELLGMLGHNTMSASQKYILRTLNRCFTVT